MPDVLPFCLSFPREYFSSHESIFRKLQSSVVHKTSPNQTYHQAPTWEIRCPRSFKLLLSEKCVQELLCVVKRLPWVGRESGIQPRSVTCSSAQARLKKNVISKWSSVTLEADAVFAVRSRNKKKSLWDSFRFTENFQFFISF